MKLLENRSVLQSVFLFRIKYGIGIIGIGLLLVFSCGHTPEKGSGRPNVLIILADDMGYGDLGAYNRHSKVPTPNIDKLASQGIMFTEAYCPVAVCSPSRYALMTGTYPWRSWNKSGAMKNYERSMIAPGQLTLPQMLKKAGYETAGFGKWHLGTLFPTTDGKKPAGYGAFYAEDNGANIDVSQAVSDGPTDRGFDQWLGFSSPSECWILDGNRIMGSVIHKKYTIDAASGTENLEKIPLEDYLPFITEKSIDYLREYSKKENDKPFFLYFSPYVPHVPLAVHPDFIGVTGAGAYADYVHELDHYVGQILDELERSGLKENTIILFASDNGSQFGTKNPGDNMPEGTRTDTAGHKPNFPLRGGKWTAYEGGVRTPLIAAWPGHFPAGVKSDQLFGLNDVMATLAPVAGYELGNGTTTDGFNLLTAFQGENDNKRTSIVVQSSSNVYGLRDGQWKLIKFPKKGRNTCYELYDLQNDPSESNNLAEQYPDKVGKMKSELHKILEGSSTTR
ncbi:sulfatase family protein [Sinomicrobium weinanense]|uniref:Arylsulfatase n=1 Tax=Sinomicrobium weinanense TaxID=2842200 RepID=A0A926JQR3_9FLAO|nr:arylsulfatase [Sinomicrobium weinanense]MBC9795752.1 arylsulfatase [Sinomicrobium weinanense]MBU3125315.1 arylsulfatase [Sinomicrobium weinanense]